MARYELPYSKEWYTVDAAKLMDTRTLRKEYTKLRDIAQKRLKRLEHDYDWTRTYQEHRDGFQKLSEIDPRDLPKAFSEIAKFVGAKGSSVQGQRDIQRKTASTLNSAIGQSGAVNSRNYRRVVSILNEARKQKIIYGSDKIVQLADATLSLDNDSFDDVLNNLESMLSHSDEVETALEAFTDSHGISDYSQVDMSEFIAEIGW